MNVRSVIQPACVTLDIRSRTKHGVIEELLGLLAATGRVSNRADALRCLLEREAKMSTGIQHGVAIPHGKTDAVTSLIAAVGLSKEGIDFASLDGAPSRIFIMTLSPLTRMGPHIQFLSAISQVLDQAEIRARLLMAQGPEEVIDTLAG